ncbi:MAG: hypothetical protein Ta2E_11670 [Mycoplasmoidaceae bacterium]|nr:MAG: hypothetical protein Ta2E_11670 [Mycoplasmoidaceae bacterium]
MILHQHFKSYDITKFNTRDIPMTDLKLEMKEACKESWLLFFEAILERFNLKYDVTKAYHDYSRYCENENYQAFGNKMFKLKILSVPDEIRTTKDNKTLRYYAMKNNLRTRYDMDNDDNIELIGSD